MSENQKQEKKSERKKFPTYGIVPLNLIPHLNRIELVTYLVLSKFQGLDDHSYPSIKKIIEYTGLSNKSVSSAIYSLTKKNLLKTKRRFGNSSIYELFYTVGEDIEQVKKELKEHNKRVKPKFLTAHEDEPPVHYEDELPVHYEDEPPVHYEDELPVHQYNKNPLEKPIIINPVCEQSSTNIITREQELTGNTLGVGSMSNSIIKENIYKYLHSKQIPIVPGSDEQAIEKHKYSPEFVYKIQRLEKLHFIVKNWRDYQNKLDPKVHIPKLLELETSPGTISWVLSNYSTDVDPYYNLIESFVRRREEERRHKEAEEERREAERQEYYATLRENQTFEQPDNRTVYEKLEEKRRERAQESAVIEEELKTERLTPDEQIRLRDLMIQGRMSLEEQLEYKSLIERNRR